MSVPLKVPEGNMPASWYHEPAFFELEKRAIFSRHWLMTTHSSRLPEAGSFLRFEMAGFDFFLIKDKQGEIHAFHNVCRHRAYPILEDKDGREGKKLILSCGYHGMYPEMISIVVCLTPAPANYPLYL